MVEFYSKSDSSDFEVYLPTDDYASMEDTIFNLKRIVEFMDMFDKTEVKCFGEGYKAHRLTEVIAVLKDLLDMDTIE